MGKKKNTTKTGAPKLLGVIRGVHLQEQLRREKGEGNKNHLDKNKKQILKIFFGVGGDRPFLNGGLDSGVILRLKTKNGFRPPWGGKKLKWGQWFPMVDMNS